MGQTILASDVADAYANYFEVHFGEYPQDLPAMQFLMVYQESQVEVRLTRYSDLAQVMLLRKLLAQLAQQRDLAIVLVVESGEPALHGAGMLPTSNGWRAVV